MAAARVLVVDDEPDIRALVREILGDEGYLVEVAADADAARLARREWQPDLVLLDIWMPRVDGISLLREWVDGGALDCVVIMMSGHATIETAVEATRLGAWDFIEKPISLAKLLLTVERAMEANRLRRENAGLRRQLAQPEEPAGQSAPMRELRRRAEHLGTHDACVLIRGERGVGKESLARWLHARSARADRPFVVVATAGMNREQARASLLGSGDDPGLLQQADGGTLFVAEIAELDSDLQQLLAQVIERGSLQRPGAAQPQPLDVRVIAASAHDLEARVTAGELRDELYYQLNVAPLGVPPLRERSEDVPELLRHYAEYFAARDHLPYRHFPVPVQNRLRQHDWPGNLRELRTLVQRLLVTGGEREVALAEVEQALGAAPKRPGAASLDVDLSLGLREARERFERDYLTRQLQAAQGSVTRLAQRVGMERTHLYRKLRDLGIDLKTGQHA
ncbi:MAG TPA: sigma-54 dependent transcriptional regulator [Rhodanobacteraceae bacterium]|nr:sigma-54 dependent transcriptional regulator [Rhodanobacteraceae bacterium]